MKNSIIETRNLTIGYKLGRGETKVIHRDLNLSLTTGDVTTLLGVNGSGKSTLIRTLCGFIPPLSGEIIIMGRNIKDYSKEKLSSILSVVLTERVNDGGLTVYEIVSLGRYPYTGFFGRLTQHDKDVIEQSLRDIGVWEMKDMFISELSDGERQKVMIAKSLAQESKIIILDEPTSFLDVKSRMEIISLLRRLAKHKKMTFLLSLHDLELSLQYSDSLWIMTKGTGMICGQTEEIILSGEINKAVNNNSSLLFNTESGGFRSTSTSEKRICYQGEDLLWVKNALMRIGYTFDDNETSTKVKVKSYNDITIGINEQVYHCKSIAELIEFIIHNS